VGSCDTALLLDQRQWRELRDDLGTDAVVFSFRNYLPAEWRPQAYGWIETDGDVVRRVSTKKPISATPRRDHAVTGAFYYRRAQLLLDGVNALVAQKRTINNEYYLDEMTNVLVESGRRVRALEVDRHVTWGTPDELRTFQYWQQHFHLAKHHPYRLELDEDFPWVEARRAR
jgi:bifunctional N-acetylglucosamine-1-phosphate-uridyltransferase/glucosamine-1-phosphate-acetyltransferase GlmU-like protein